MSVVRHLSVRVPWHDRGWDGHVCDKPLENSSCLALKLIAENRKDEIEKNLANEAFEGLSGNEVPPCLRASASFLSPTAYSFESVMAYSPWSNDHKHIRPRTVHVPAWGAVIVPYRWMLKESGFELAKELELSAAFGSGASEARLAAANELGAELREPEGASECVCAAARRG